MEATNKKIFYVLIDTSYLRTAGFNDPDFRKLLKYSKENVLKVFIPHIAWEERRTQYFDNAYKKVRKVEDAFEELNAMLPGDFILGGLTPPGLTIWKKAEIDTKSREVMENFATENKIEIVAVGSDHAERTWRRYFDVDPPFNPNQERENRRKDIPDAWILEAAIDVKANHSGLWVLCCDGKLSNALTSADIRTTLNAQEILDEIEQEFAPMPVAAVVEAVAIAPAMAADELRLYQKVSIVLTEAQEHFKYLDSKILGYVTYLGSPSKDQLFGLLSRSGVSAESAKNVAVRLSIAGVITDTGNHYLTANKEAGELAAALVEAEIITLLAGEA